MRRTTRLPAPDANGLPAAPASPRERERRIERADYRHPALRQLKEQQVRFTPRERRLEQIDRAEALLRELDPARKYPYEYLVFRITGFRPDRAPDLIVDGTDALHDLRLFVQDLSRTTHQPAVQAGEPVLTVDDVSRRFNVSTRTVARWAGTRHASRHTHNMTTAYPRIMSHCDGASALL